MLIKEYRIPLPVTVEEYRIAQLYMIAKKSRDESEGAGSGVEFLVNEPYEDGPGGNGQYTHKIYHIGSHIPGWLKSLLPKSALTAEEKAWNAYPYTKTRYTCPYLEKFSLEIETYYCGDAGHQENVFNLTGSDFRNRIVDVIDVVKDVLYGTDYVKEENPKLFVSQKTGRGPLEDNWIEDYWNECKGKEMPLENGKAVMCAYKLCRVEVKYWGMQSKSEKFIHDVALRKTMLRAHRQAWAWQDEWHGLTMEDIRQIEKQCQETLKHKMGAEHNEGSDNEDPFAATFSSIEEPETINTPGLISPVREEDEVNSECLSKDSPERTRKCPNELTLRFDSNRGSAMWSSRTGGNSTTTKLKRSISPDAISNKSFDYRLATNWRMESIRRDSDTGSEDEFYDCQEDLDDSTSLTKWSSLDLLTAEDIESAPPVLVTDKQDDSIFSHSFIRRVTCERDRCRSLQPTGSTDVSQPSSPTNLSPSHHSCSTTVLLLVFHAGSVLDANIDPLARKSDVTTFRSAFEGVTRQHYPSLAGHVTIKHIPCVSLCTDGLGILSSLSPYSFDVSPSTIESTCITHDSIPIGVIPVFATASPDYQDSVTKVILTANKIYHEFLNSDEGRGFTGQICIIGDSVGSIVAYDALCRTTQAQQLILEGDPPTPEEADSPNKPGRKSVDFQINDSNRRRSSSSDSHNHPTKLDFDVFEFFMFGSPLPIVLAYRKILLAVEERNSKTFSPIMRPACMQVYNLFHPTDPIAVRVEPLLSARFSMLPPINVARYQKYPLGNGQPSHLLEFIQANPQLFADGVLGPATVQTVNFRRMSEISIQSNVSGLMDALPIHVINALTQKWWGPKRLDYALYCPEGLANFPTNALPHLFHASYWESLDVIAFILRQIGRSDSAPHCSQEDKDGMSFFSPGQPREKWIKKRTSVKLKVRMKFGSENVSANHRANDVIFREGAPQVLTARFMYGPLDMVTLTGEKVDIHVMKDPPAGEWTLLATEVTDKTGRVSYTIPNEMAVGYGMYPMKMVVRGDHTAVDFYMAVVPPKTECVVFSIDGSFTASVSVTGRDPKVRAGAVDVVRHWQELGYLIIYVTGRPDIQQQKVVSWLAQHNFPHGLISFADGLTTDPLGHKADYLKTLVREHGVIIHAAYGSSKDISVYSSIGLKADHIFIVGKVSKKQHSMAQVLTDGYAAHLSTLLVHGGSRPAQGNARMVIPRGYFGLPGQNMSLRRRRSAKRTTSYPMTTHPLPMTTEGAILSSRGMSPHPPRSSTRL